MDIDNDVTQIGTHMEKYDIKPDISQLKQLLKVLNDVVKFELGFEDMANSCKETEYNFFLLCVESNLKKHGYKDTDRSIVQKFILQYLNNVPTGSLVNTEDKPE